MTSIRLWAVAGALIGFLLGGMLQHQRDPGWLWGTLGGAAGLAVFALTCRLVGRVIGEPAGWAVGGPVGLAVGGAILLLAIGNPGDPLALVFVGGVGGAISGAICGPLCGAAVLDWQPGEAAAGRRHKLLLQVGAIAVVFCLGVAAIVLVIVRSE